MVFYIFNLSFILPTFIKIKNITKYNKNINRFQRERLEILAINTSVFVSFTLIGIILFLNKLTLLMMLR